MGSKGIIISSTYSLYWGSHYSIYIKWSVIIHWDPVGIYNDMYILDTS